MTTMFDIPLPHLTFILEQVNPVWLIPQPSTGCDIISDAIIKLSKQLNCECVTTGSLAQGLFVTEHRMKNDWDSVQCSDIDIMAVVKKAAPCIQLDTAGTHSGYLRLRHTRHATACQFNVMKHVYMNEKDVYISNNQLRPHTFHDISQKIDIRGNMDNVMSIGSTIQVSITGPAYTVNPSTDKCTVIINHSFTGDMVAAIEISVWPETASEWINRPRVSDWPNAKLISQTVEGGHHIVPVAHSKSSHPEIEWRFSFAKAENMLAKTLSIRQRQCFILFKIIVSYLISPHTALSTYSLKNVFFWALEKIPASIWEESQCGLGYCFVYLLDQLILCLSAHDIPHYFITTNNLIETKSTEIVLDITRKLYNFRRRPVKHMKTFVMLYQTLPPCNLEMSLKPIFDDVTASRFYSNFNNSKYHSHMIMLRDSVVNNNTIRFRESHIEIEKSVIYQSMFDNQEVLPPFLYLGATHVWPQPSEDCLLAWVGFLVYVDRVDDAYRERALELVNFLFQRGLKVCYQRKEYVKFVKYSCYYVVYLMYVQKIRDIAIPLLDVAQRCIERGRMDEFEHSFVKFERNSCIVVDDSIQNIMDKGISTASFIPSHIMMMFLYIKCCCQVNMKAKAHKAFALMHVMNNHVSHGTKTNNVLAVATLFERAHIILNGSNGTAHMRFEPAVNEQNEKMENAMFSQLLPDFCRDTFKIDGDKMSFGVHTTNGSLIDQMPLFSMNNVSVTRFFTAYIEFPKRTFTFDLTELCFCLIDSNLGDRYFADMTPRGLFDFILQSNPLMSFILELVSYYLDAGKPDPKVILDVMGWKLDLTRLLPTFWNGVDLNK